MVLLSVRHRTVIPSLREYLGEAVCEQAEVEDAKPT
jgi:hypothetical protein